MTDERDHPEVDGPTAMEPTAGRSVGSPDEPVEPQPFDSDGLAEYGPTTIEPIRRYENFPDEPIEPAPSDAVQPPDVDGPTAYDRTAVEPISRLAGTSSPASVDSPATTGSWPFDEFDAPPDEPFRPPPRQLPPVAAHSPAYYVSLGATVVLVIGLVALAAVIAVMRPQREVAGTAGTGLVIPAISTTTEPPPPSQPGPLTELAAHPLSGSTARMGDATCALPRFDPADDQQAAFYAAAKVCADVAWRDVLREAGLDEASVTVVTVTGATRAGSCGELAPTSPAIQCDGTVYLTPAHLRDTEQNGRYPGRYLGVFLREYVRALQYTTGLERLVTAVRDVPPAELDARLAQQATCLTGVVASAMSGRGAVDSNITGEIRARLSTVDAPPDAQSWLDRGFQQRTLAACNTWA